MSPARKCFLPGCQRQADQRICLFTFPKNEDVKAKWLQFITRHCGDVNVPKTARLCSQHFTPECCSNWYRRQLGFTTNPLVLVGGAEPTIYLPGRTDGGCSLRQPSHVSFPTANTKQTHTRVQQGLPLCRHSQLVEN